MSCNNLPCPEKSVKVGISKCRHTCTVPATYKTIILKPNCLCGHNTLTQCMLSEENVKYVIKYDFTLGGEEITVPKNCILEFDGGSLRNGIIVGQDTVFINVGDVTIWGERLTREGTWIEHSGGSGGESHDTDRPYNPADFSGLGKVYLKKNIVNNKNILVQDAFYKDGPNQTRVPNTDTVFVVQYDFDLDNQEITVPAGSVLEFDGGSINNGTIVGDYTSINAGIEKIFGTNLSFVGSANLNVAYPEWFGAKGDGITDDTLAIQKCIDFTETIGGGTTKFSPKQYKLTSVTLKTRTNLDGCGQGATILVSDGENLNTDETGIIVYPINVGLSYIKNMTILGTNNAQNGIVVVPKPETGSSPLAGAYGIHENRKAIQTKQAYKDVTISNVYVGRCHYGIWCKYEAYRILIEKSNIKFCNYGILFETTDSSITECYIEHCNYDGLIVNASCNKISTIKSIWNGSADPINSYGIRINAHRNQVINCEVQDNYGSGIRVTGTTHTITNVLSNSNAWIDRDDPQYAAVKEYEQVDGQGLAEWVLYTINSSFNNCVAASYRNDRPLPKYPILYQAASQQLGTDIKILSPNITALAKSPIYPDFPIRTTNSFNIIAENLDVEKGYKLQGEKLKINIPICENIETINMGVICEFIPADIKERIVLYRFYKFFGLFIDPAENENSLTFITERGNRYPQTITPQQVDLTKPIRCFHRATYIGKDNNGVPKINSYFCFWYYSLHRKGYIFAYSANDITYDQNNPGPFSDYNIDSVGFRRHVSYLNADGSTRNTIYLRKLLATYDNCIPDSISYPGYPLYDLHPEYAFDYLTVRPDAGNPEIGPTSKRPLFASNGAKYYDETLDLPINFIRNAWGNISLVPIGNVSPIVDGNPVVEGTINANDLEAGTIGIYNLGNDYKEQFNYPFKSCYVFTYSSILNSNNWKIQIATPMNFPSGVSMFHVGENRPCYRMKISGTYTSWKMFTGETVGTKIFGITDDRPIGSSIFIGYQYIDTTLGKPIYAKEISDDNVVWIDSDGTIV